MEVLTVEGVKSKANVKGQIYLEVGSTVVEAIAYDLETSVCVVTLCNHEDYIYKDFPFELFVEGVNEHYGNGSVGTWYNRKVRGKW